MPGFTLLEVLLTVALLGFITFIFLPLTQTLLTGNELQTTADQVVKLMRNSQNNARSGLGDTNWGVSFQTGKMVEFEGTSYSLRVQTQDNNLTLPSKMTVTASDIIFTELTGSPSAATTVTLTEAGRSITITINSRGMISY